MFTYPRCWRLSEKYTTTTVNKHATENTGTLSRFARVAVYPSCAATSRVNYVHTASQKRREGRTSLMMLGRNSANA